MVTDSANHRSIMIINKKLQKTTDNSFQGKALNTFNTIFHSIEKDGLGNVYVGSYDGRLYKILDWDLWWQPCSRPIPDYSGEYELSVTHDNTIWISCPEHGLYFSKDGAQSWQNAESGIIENEKLGRIYQLNDSSFITFSTTRGVILLSNDSGYNWSPMNTPHNTSLCYVSERKEIFIFTRDDGFSIYRSTDFGQKYTLIYSGEFSTNNFSQNPTFIKHENFCYLLIPGAEIVKTTDFSHFEKLRTIDVQYHLNIDHLGTIFISGDEGQPSYVLAPPAK
jgi:hypothetical protein